MKKFLNGSPYLYSKNKLTVILLINKTLKISMNIFRTYILIPTNYNFNFFLFYDILEKKFNSLHLMLRQLEFYKFAILNIQ